MLFLQSILINLVLTMSSGPKYNAVLLTAPIFASFCVYHTDLGGGVGGSSYSSFSPTPGRTRLHPDFSLQYPSLTTMGRSPHGFVGFLAHRL